MSLLFFKLKLLGKICTVLYFVYAAYFCISINSMYFLHVTVGLHQKSYFCISINSMYFLHVIVGLHQKSLRLNRVFMKYFSGFIPGMSNLRAALRPS